MRCRSTVTSRDTQIWLLGSPCYLASVSYQLLILPTSPGNITEFWRRWHISLSSWLRDYLYIPLGGNRKGQIRTYINLFLTMLLGGLWHGAALRFVLWGAIHGVALALHKLYMQIFDHFGWRRREPLRWQRFAGQIITFHLVCFAGSFSVQTRWRQLVR